VGTDGLLSYAELIAEVRRLCAQRSSGCIFITTSDNHAIRFELRSGKIIALSFRQHTGAKAVESIQRITGGQLRYSAEVVERAPQADLPPTPELLAALGASGMMATSDSNGAGSAPPRADFDRSRTVIESELAEYLGPMATLVCQEHMALATDVNDLVESLARELRDAAKAASFREQVRKRLAGTPASA
jgi:hypothetical protein